MPQLGQKVITVSGKRLIQLQKIYEKEKIKQPNLKFATFIAESAIIELERRKILKEAQLLSLVGFGDDCVIIKDIRKPERLFEVQIRGNSLKCIGDDKSDCIHVGFSLALPEVRKALSR